MEATGGLVRALFKLATRMGDGQDDRRRRKHASLVFLRIDRYPARLIPYGHPSVLVDAYQDVLAVSGVCLVDGVVHRLINEVAQPGGAGRPDVHPGTATDRSNTLENLDIGTCVGLTCTWRRRLRTAPPFRNHRNPRFGDSILGTQSANQAIRNYFKYRWIHHL